jgi:hypothetical protein
MAKRPPSPSPWTTYTPSLVRGNKDRWIVDGKGRMIAVVWYDKNMVANARLISAAPDLLAACEAFLEFNSACDFNYFLIMKDLAQTAVNKAKGN